MKTLNLSHTQFLASQHAKARLEKVIAALDEACEHLDGEPFVLADDLISYLKDDLDDHLKIIEQGEARYSERPEKLISKALGIFHGIPGEINLIRSSINHKKRLYEDKLQDLLKKGFTQAEIDKIIAPLGQAEIDEANAEIERLKSESCDLLNFASDVFWNLDRLKSTRLAAEALAIETKAEAA
ncbi:hypothetical protein [Methylotuvimicrobium sp. KM2]|uniref:hypothetical protein n=1 Tax=Methylotuvimicrobium sp. KM2 TaxID=3133976 RepID=UPI003101A787